MTKTDDGMSLLCIHQSSNVTKLSSLGAIAWSFSILFIPVAFLFSVHGCSTTDSEKGDAKDVFSDAKVGSLVLAAEKGMIEEINALVKNGVNVNAKGLHDMTPLLRTLLVRNKEGFSALLRHGADPNVPDKHGKAVVTEAAMDVDPFWLEEALKKGGKPDLIVNGNPIAKGWTPIYYEITNKRLANVNLLIKAGADLNHKNEMKTCPLLFAAQRPAFDVVYHLVVAGADYRQKNSADDDLVSWISRRNDRYVVEEEQKKWFNKTVDLLKAKGAKFELSKD